MYPLSVRYVSKQAEKSLKSIPVSKAKELLDDIELIRYGVPPLNGDIDTLQSISSKVKELRINGRPAYRLAYVIDGPHLTILHAFKKTANGRDKENLETVRSRFKLL
jgi:phage-related protein